MTRPKVLVVDDEKDVLVVLEKRLTKAGYSVLISDNGKDGLAMAKKEKPDLILLDIVMPDMSGSEVAAKLKNDPVTKNIPVMFLTCLFTKGDEVEQGHEIGGYAFIAKPYNPEELLLEIKRHITS